MSVSLSPAQQATFEQLQRMLSLFSIVGLVGGSGVGKTTVLRKLQEITGGEWIGARQLLDASRVRHPLSLEETFDQMVEAALRRVDYIYLDDLALLTSVVDGCGSYPRSGFLSTVLTSISAAVEAAHKKLVYACSYTPSGLQKKGFTVGFPDAEPADYEFFCQAYLGPARAGALDYRKIHRFARYLDAYDLRTVGLLLREEKELSTDTYIETLRSQGLTSNVDLGEVQNVSLADLKGVDDVIESLEKNVVLPLEQIELADELRLKPKRGVLLAGPPGTGKTTVGRALAHRLKSKFFLIDGTFISGTSDFYWRVNSVFEQAKHNAPAVIFVDDSDVIFESGGELGLYRYLLTMLDGLESQSNTQVCVMVTAMDVGHLPPALIRSGRIELWLEMRLPNAAARASILAQLLVGLPPAVAALDVERLAEAAEGFTGADLKRFVEDGKLLFAHDKVHGRPQRPATDYFLQAIQTVRESKALYAAADARARTQRPSRPVYYDQSTTPDGVAQ